MPSACQLIHATANRPGAIAIIQLHGEAGAILRELTGVNDWPLHRLRLVNFSDIDEGLAVRLSAQVAQLMPHGGPRVVQRLTARLLELGATIDSSGGGESDLDPQLIYPEATDRIEALTMLTIARAESPLAIDLLLDQPRRWREFVASGRQFSPADCERSRRLNRLIVPPMVVVAGIPNVGKSTLSNALLGRTMSITLDMPGTTRDYTAGRINLAGLVVDWHDTPGIRESEDPIERRAIEIARRLISKADVLIAMTEPPISGGDLAWPDLPRKPDLRVINKVDLFSNVANVPPDCLPISAQTGLGVPEFVAAIREHLMPSADLHHPGPWLFDDRLLDRD